MLLPDADETAAHLVASRIRTVAALAMCPAGRSVTLSIGLRTWTRDPPNREVMLRQADLLMYEAKRSGGDGVRTGQDGYPWHGLRMSGAHDLAQSSPSHPASSDDVVVPGVGRADVMRRD